MLLMTIEISHFTHCSDFGCVVVQFYPWFKFSFLLFSKLVKKDKTLIHNTEIKASGR